MINFIAEEELKGKEYTNEEREIIKKSGICIKTNKSLDIYCYDCSKLICSVCLFNSHKAHKTESTFKISQKIFDLLTNDARDIHNHRIDGLSSRLKNLKKNKEDLEGIKAVNKSYKTLSDTFSSASLDLNNYIQNREEDINASIKQIKLVNNEVNDRKTNEINDFNEFNDYLKENQKIKTECKLYITNFFIKKKKGQCKRDKNYYCLIIMKRLLIKLEIS